MAINFLNFNKRADIGNYDDARNPYTGSPDKTFTKEFSRFCAVRTRTMNQTYQLTNFNMQDTVDLVFRHDPLIQSNLYIQLDGIIYEIVSISPDESTNLNPYDIVTVRQTTKIGSAS